MAVVELVVVLVTLVVCVWSYFQRSFSYWKRKGIPYIAPKFPFGTSENPFARKEHFGVRIKNQYHELKSRGHKHAGLYTFSSPFYLPLHPEYLRNILSKDFNYFVDRGMYYNEKDDPISAHLFNMEGQKWKNLRMKLTSTFTSGKMKMMFPTLTECGNQMKEYLDQIKSEPIDIKNVLVRFTTDVIGSCAFGIDCNSFKNSNSEFTKYGKKIFEPVSRFQAIRNVIAFAKPSLARSVGFVMTNRDSANFFMQIVKNTANYREETKYARKDFMQILLDLKNSTNEEEKLTIEEVAAQAFVFFLAGFETSSTTMTFCLFELAQNQDIQDKLREEIKEVLKDGAVTYEAVMEMKYLEQVIDETLRKYPPGSLIPRVCTKDYTMSDTDVTIEKGTRVLIPVMGLHHDPEYFPYPEIFDPDRFSNENKNNIRPFTYMPFGEGPRICIGLRFGLMQAKVGLVTLLKHFRFKLNHKTTTPLIMDQYTFILTAKNPIWLDVEAINK